MKYISEKKDSWEDYLDTCIYAYNTSKQESSKFTPFELMFARKPVLPIDLQYDKRDAGDIFEDYLDKLHQSGSFSTLRSQSQFMFVCIIMLCYKLTAY